VAHEFQTDIDAIGRISAVPTILDVVCRTTGMGFAAVVRVTEGRWIACNLLDTIDFGLAPGGELKVETTICHEVRQSHEPVVINNVAEDPVYCGHPTPAMYGFQSYISMPIVRADGSFFGTLCAIDPRPAKLANPETIGMFRLFAELIAAHLDTNERMAATEARLLDERRAADLREEFIAVLGHDLRNPVASIDAGTKLLLKTPLDARALTIVGLIQGSVIRMSGLIDNVLDFARGRLGGGLTLNRTSDIFLLEPVNCDSGRIGQLFSNLLGNALTHGKEDGPIRVGAASQNGIFELWVANQGEPIAAEMRDSLFQPFFRGNRRPTQQGLGLGLYIASAIAEAHGGTLEVSSSPEETRFTFRMPSR
jgi:signal transduction histidine kinase